MNIISTYKEEFISIGFGTIQAIIINSIIYFLANSFKIFSEDILIFGSTPINTTHVILGTSVAGLLFCIIYVYISTNYPNLRIKYFTYTTFIGLAISFILPTTINFATTAMILALILMEIVTVVCIYSSLSRRIFNK